MIQSLFWLLAYFWHFARPALVILLDPEIKESVMYSPSRLFCSSTALGREEQEAVATSEAEAEARERARRPIVKGGAAAGGEAGDKECRVALI